MVRYTIQDIKNCFRIIEKTNSHRKVAKVLSRTIDGLCLPKNCILRDHAPEVWWMETSDVLCKVLVPLVWTPVASHRISIFLPFLLRKYNQSFFSYLLSRSGNIIDFDLWNRHISEFPVIRSTVIEMLNRFEEYICFPYVVTPVTTAKYL